MTDINFPLEEKLAAEIVRASRAYYMGKPIMSDDLFDELVNKLHSVNPNHKVFGKPYGGDSLLSLDNCRLDEWYRGKRKNTSLVIEPKIDGVALALVYQSGELQRAYTRTGRDVTRYALEVPDIPLEVPRLGQFTVRGELYAFNEFSPKSQRVAAAQLRRIEPECHLLSFVAFQILNSQNDHKENLATLASYDFNIVPYVEANTYDEVKKYHDDWLDSKFFEHLPTDGIVVKVNSRSIQKQLGQSTRCPHWAVALKG
jgi:DNA ligase (NAD+)|tara:strand:- start:84 stop:854 length:771 start_codon:yes stop_codon:yes gene_type:complete